MNTWYEKIVGKTGYNGCKNCRHQIDVLRACEWLESGGDGRLHIICPKWEKNNCDADVEKVAKDG